MNKQENIKSKIEQLTKELNDPKSERTTTTKQVRNVLMNELGLSKAYIRELASDLVVAELKRLIANREMIVTQKIEEAFSPSSSNMVRFDAIIDREIDNHFKAAVEKRVKDLLQVKLNVDVIASVNKTH